MNSTVEIALSVFRVLPDPRVERTKLYRLETLMFIAMCTYLSGGDGFNDMEAYARARCDWLRENIGMESIPSHDTFNRVFQAISPSCFGECLVKLSRQLRECVTKDVIALDGKTHRGTAKNDSSALHVLNVWSVENRLVLGQLAVDEKSNEITAVPQILEILDVEGCVITADALNCQKTITAKVIEKKADYILPVKGNHPTLFKELSLYMDDLSSQSPPGFEEIEKDHGRIATRRCWQSEAIDWYEDRSKWAGLRSFVLVESVREYGDKIETTRRYYISSLPLGEAYAAQCIRSHWQVENALHWCLDVVFHEDQSRARTRHAAMNLGTLRSICLNLLRRIPGKLSLKAKRFKIALNDNCLLEALKF